MEIFVNNTRHCTGTPNRALQASQCVTASLSMLKHEGEEEEGEEEEKEEEEENEKD